jgi:hypothetical protein
MKTIQLFLAVVISSLLFTSCILTNDNYDEPDPILLEEVLNHYDLWYVDFNKTTGYGDVAFVSKAFTFSFQNGRLYANNNIVGIGQTGNGYGIRIGDYSTDNDILEIDHILDGNYDFEVIVDDSNSIRLYNYYEKVTYYLEGYNKSQFDYDMVFYDNMEYFLQEYEEWGKTYTSEEGEINAFDNENFLAFTPENITTFYSSIDDIETPIADRIWDFEGSYEISNIYGYDDIKDLTLNYDNGDTEEFELSVIGGEDRAISLYHYASGTTYEFDGYGFIQYKKDGKSNAQARKRNKVNRKTINRKAHSKTMKKEHTIENKTKAPARK